MSRLTRDGTAEPVSRDQILRRERGQGIQFPYSADHEQDWEPYPVDPYPIALRDDHTTVVWFYCCCMMPFLLLAVGRTFPTKTKQKKACGNSFQL